jgi:hypothetical protein
LGIGNLIEGLVYEAAGREMSRAIARRLGLGTRNEKTLGTTTVPRASKK